MSRKVCFYIMRKDTGFAPNPYHGLCTLAACTPNHMLAKLTPGDWIVGCFRSGSSPRAVYVMKVDRTISLDDYYRDPHFEMKKAHPAPANRRCGDNIYFRGPGGILEQAAEAKYFHTDARHKQQDVQGDRVFISRDFVYFGQNAVPLPENFIHLLPRRSIKYLQEGDPHFEHFLTWQDRLGRGLKGSPRDSRERACSPTAPANCTEQPAKPSC